MDFVGMGFGMRGLRGLRGCSIQVVIHLTIQVVIWVVGSYTDKRTITRKTSPQSRQGAKKFVKTKPLRLSDLGGEDES